MDAQFWHDRWTLREIGFHQDQVNGLLASAWSRFVEPGGGEAFVPLCGKSLDMVWLRTQGHRVLGVELSPLAVAEFFQEQTMAPGHQVDEGFDIYQSDGFRLMCGDFFSLQPRHLAEVSAVYDRAALIALPRDMQAAYVRHLLAVLPQRPPIFLVSLDYDSAEMSGPPFATSLDRVERLFQPEYRIAWQESREAIDDSPRLRERGVSRLTESACWLHALP
jgi:thiopurine S-methyltransferase